MQLVNFIFSICFVQFVMMILQMSGVFSTVSTRISELTANDGSAITRVYLPAYFYASIAFFIALCLKITKSDFLNSRWLNTILVISALSILLSYTRTYWMATLIGVFLVYLTSSIAIKKQLIKKLMIIVVLISPVLLYSGGGFIMERFESVFTEEGSDEGNFIFRFTENPQRLQAFADNPIMGPGFVHSSFAANIFNFVIDEKHLSESQIERALILQTNDSGLITLLVSFGLLGGVWVIFKLYVLLRLYQHEARNYEVNVHLGIMQGAVVFVFSIWLTCITTYGFTYPDGIVALALALYLCTCLKLVTGSDENL